MEELIKLSRIVTNSLSLKSVLIIDNKLNSKEGKFINNILSGSYDTDEKAAADLYESNANDVRYKMLKHRLKKKLYNNLFFLDYGKLKSKPHYLKSQECLTLLHHGHLLLWQYELKLAESVANKVLLIAKHFDFTEHKLNALELLASSLSEQGELKKFNKNNEELQKTLKQRWLESEATSTLQSAKLNIAKSIKSRKQYFNNLPNTIARLEEIWKLVETFNSFYAYYRVYIMYSELSGDFSKIADITIQAEEWLKEGKINALRFDSKYNKFVLIYALFRAKDYAKGLHYAELYVSDFDTRSSNWFAFMENYILLALHARNEKLGVNLLHRIYNNPTFNKISSAAKERITLYSSYLNLLSSTNELPKNLNIFFSSLPEYSKDKQGFNVAILIYQFILYLEKADVEALIYRIESLKKYILTHLKDNFSLRSRLFLKLLMLTVTEDFDAKQCRKKGEPLYQKLINTPTPGDAYAEIEIIPYEYLWEHILHILDKQALSMN